jgi:aspartyl-tRNA synthetase
MKCTNLDSNVAKDVFATSYRDFSCGSLGLILKGRLVKLCGWVHNKRDHGGVVFVDLRDNYGIVQLVFDAHSVNIDSKLVNFDFENVDKIKLESVIQVEGILLERNADDKNLNIKNGEIEIVVQKLHILSSASNIPFQVNQEEKCNEEIRLKYRFLDLRRDHLHHNIILRSQVINYIRQKMTERGFYEIQTPILTSSSPEGARDYLVPSRVHKGKFYALPQAPQQFKQLLMISGFDKYFQIAPCFRDEDSRADRSPGEFYQLDLEMSFVEQKDVFETIEPILKDVFVKFGNKKIPDTPFEIIKYNCDVTEFFAKSDFSIFANSISKGGAVVRAIPVKNCSEQPRSFFDQMISFAIDSGAKGLAYIIIDKEGNLKSPIAKFLKDYEIDGIKKAANLSNGDAVFFSCDREKMANKIAGLVRTEAAKKLDLIDKNEFKFCWIVDFPYFEYDEENKKLDFMHNPFSKPKFDLRELEKLIGDNNQEELLKVEAYQYDIVCNGIELSSGAIRNTDLDFMYKSFNLVGYSKEEVDEKFGNLISAFKYGVPPHGGIAPIL